MRAVVEDAANEALGIHEKTIEPLRDSLSVEGFLYYTWVIPGIVALLVPQATVLGVRRLLPPHTRSLFFAAAVERFEDLCFLAFDGRLAEAARRVMPTYGER